MGDDPDGVTLGYLRTTYDAVFLALGQDVGRRLGAEGAQARGVIGAMEFLRETGLGRPVTVGASVLVIGGGNTASDAARSAIRLGGAGGNQASATIVSLEAEDELLIQPEDLAQARDEGVLFRPRTALVSVLTGEDGNVRGAVLAGARLARDEQRRGQAADHRGHRVRGAVRHDPGRDRAGAGARLAPRALHRATGWSRPTNSAACRTRRPRCSRAAT